MGKSQAVFAGATKCIFISDLWFKSEKVMFCQKIILESIWHETFITSSNSIVHFFFRAKYFYLTGCATPNSVGGHS